MAFRLFRLLTRTQRKFLVVSIALMMLGLVLFIKFPFPILWNAYESNNYTACVWELGECDNFGGYEYYLRDNKGNLETFVGGGLNFHTSEVFSVYNPVSFGITFNVDHPQFVKSIFLIMDFNDKINFRTLDNQTFDNISFLLNTYTPTVTPLSFYGTPLRAIPLYQTGPNTFTNTNQTVFTVTGNFTLTAMVVDDKNITHIGSRYGPVFELKDIRYKEIADENIQAKIDSRTNLALAWVVISISPMIVGADFIARIYLND